MVASVGLDHPAKLLPQHVSRRVADDRVETYEDIYPPLAPNALIAGTPDPRFATAWRVARADSFLPAEAAVVTVDRASTDTAQTA